MKNTHQYVRAVAGRQSLLDVMQGDTLRDRPDHVELLLVGEPSSLSQRAVSEFANTGPWTVESHQANSRSALRAALTNGHDFDLVLLLSTSGPVPAKWALDLVLELRPSVRCIALCAKTDGEEAIELMRAGAADCLSAEAGARLALAMQREIAHGRERGLAHARRKELEEQLLRAQKMDALGRLAGGIAHEFNNALTVVLSFAGFVRDDLGPDDPRLGDIVEVLRAADKAAALTRQLLMFSRRRAAEPRTVLVNTLLQSQEKILKRVLGEHIELVLQLQKDPWTVHIDPALFEQLIMNLVVNARDSMASGGTLVIRTRNVQAGLVSTDERETSGLPDVWWDEHVLLEIADTGSGMDEVTMARVFEPLFTTRGSKASGLGLSVCYGIVRQANGDIDVESQVGAGTTVRVVLPRATGRSDATRQHAALSRLEGSETVLVVEDEDAVLQTVVRTLKGAGYQVLFTSKPDQAIPLLAERETGADLLVTDVVMPGQSGTQLARQCLVRWPQMKVIFMTGYSDEGIDPIDLQSGRSRLLAKPFTGARLLRTVRQLLDA